MAAGPLRAQKNQTVVADFDQVSPETFAFKDEKGSVFNASASFYDKEKGGNAGIRYRIVPGGWGGWGIPLRGLDASGHRYLTFELKGEKGGELFEVGLRDKSGQEKKLPIKQYADATVKWQKVTIPLLDFPGVNLASLDNVSLGFNESHGGGRVYVDNLKFEGTAAEPAKETVQAAPELASKSLVDGFERPNPSDAYQVFQGDDSSLRLTSSRIVQEGDYALEMEYQFSTSRPWGSWVSAMRYLREPLNWSGAAEMRVWVKGDGSDTAFRFRITELDGETWEFVDTSVLRSLRWTLQSMPFRQFRVRAATRTNGRLDLGKIRFYHIDLVSSASRLTPGSKLTAGRVYVDHLYLVGEEIRTAQAAPAGTVPQLRAAVAAIGNVDFTMVGYTEYFFTPEKKSEVNQYAKLIANAKVNKFSARAEFGSVSQEFGQAAAYVGSSVTSTENRFSNVELQNFQVVANNVTPYLTALTLGNVFVDYSPYTFAPSFGVFGFKGATAEGDYEQLNYHVFALKHAYNSFTTGSRLRLFSPRFNITGYGVYWEEHAKLTGASAVSGATLSTAESLELRRVAQDLVYNVETEARLLQDRVTLRGVYGYNEYTQSATVSTDPFNPVYDAPLAAPYNPAGKMWRGRLETDGLLWPGLNLAYGYRDVATAYKPRYRQIPPFFDDLESDQWGHNIRVSQFAQGWILSNEYDSLRRHSNSAYFRHRYNWGLGYYGYRGVDVAFNQEYRREKYVFTSDRSDFTVDRNEKIIGTEIYVRTQLSPRMAYWIRPRQERIWHPATNRNLVADILLMRFEYYITSNAHLFAEHKTSRFGDPAFEPQGFPYDDNYTRVSLEVTF